MKKVFLFLILSVVTSFAFISCSKDETTEIETKDLILGTWYLESISGKSLTDCDKKSNMTFKESGKMAGTEYYFDDTTNSCDIDGALTETDGATWKNLGNNKYESKLPGGSETMAVTFSDNNKTMTSVTDNKVEVWKKK